MSKVIIVCGLSGSGKTTLATELSKQTNIVCLHKDSIKESLYDHTNASSLEDSRRLGQLSIKLMIDLAEQLVVNNVDVILEAPFNYSEDYKIFEQWIGRYGASIYSIICTTSEAEMKLRFDSRPRHNAHHDLERTYVQKDEAVYDNLPGQTFKITTDRPSETLVGEVIEKFLKVQ